MLVKRFIESNLRCSSSGVRQALFSAQAATASSTNPYYDVPEGHKNSDLSQAACNISLSRRRELTLRQDVKVEVNGQTKSLADVFKGERAVIFGLPNCGQVCAEKHIPGFIKQFNKLKEEGVSKIFCIAVGNSTAASEFIKKIDLDTSKISLLSDPTGAFTRQLGVELGPIDAPGPRSLRYAAFIEDGILLKMRVDASPADVKQSSAENMVDVVMSCNGKRPATKSMK